MTYTGKIINFELLYADDPIKDLHKRILVDIDQAAEEGCDAIVGLMLVDGFLYKNNEEFYAILNAVQDYATAKGIKKKILVLGMAEQYQHKLDARGLDYEIVFWDFNVNLVYQSYKDKSTAQWNSSADKFLFLGGVPSRPNRISLLYNYYISGLLENSVWSFFPPWTDNDKIECRQLLKDVPANIYDKFLVDCTSSIDTLYDEAKDYSRLSNTEIKQSNIHNTQWCQDPSYIDPKVFESTAFSVVSEGNVYAPGNDYRFLTEKTWRAVINRHPFIFAGEPEQFAHLESLGLRSFTDYLTIKDYPYITSIQNRFNAIVDNTKHLLETFKEHSAQIQADVDANYNVFLQIVEQNKQTLDKLQQQYSLTDIDYWFGQKSFTHLV